LLKLILKNKLKNLISDIQKETEWIIIYDYFLLTKIGKIFISNLNNKNKTIINLY
jgi:hypothetical protein